jgi:hypothetical protein
MNKEEVLAIYHDTQWTCEKYHIRAVKTGKISDASQRKNPEKYHEQRVRSGTLGAQTYHTIYKKKHLDEYHQQKVRAGKAGGPNRGLVTDKILRKDLERYHKLKSKAGMASFKSQLKRSTDLEQKFIKFFTKNILPYKYVGDGSFLIDNKNPDFIHSDGKKVCIEVCNKYDKDYRFGSWKVYATERIKHFAKYGWRCIVLWDVDLDIALKEGIVE